MDLLGYRSCIKVQVRPTILEHDPESGYRSSENSTLPQQARAGSLGGVLINTQIEGLLSGAFRKSLAHSELYWVWPERTSATWEKRFRDGLLTATVVTKHLKRATEMMRPDAGLHSGQGRWQVSEPCPTWPRDHFCRTPSTASVMGRPSATDSSLCRVKLDPNALIKERYVGMSTAKLIQNRWRRNGNIAIRYLEYRAEKRRSVTLDCHSNFHRRTPYLSRTMLSTRPSDSRPRHEPCRGRPNKTTPYIRRSPAAEKACRRGETPASGVRRPHPTG
jgi:hypothetical protein